MEQVTKKSDALQVYADLIEKHNADLWLIWKEAQTERHKYPRNSTSKLAVLWDDVAEYARKAREEKQNEEQKEAIKLNNKLAAAFKLLTDQANKNGHPPEILWMIERLETTALQYPQRNWEETKNGPFVDDWLEQAENRCMRIGTALFNRKQYGEANKYFRTAEYIGLVRDESEVIE